MAETTITYRKRHVLLVARQIAIANGYTWTFTPSASQSKVQAKYMTTAESIVATIERGMSSFRWADGEGKSRPVADR